MQKLLMVFFSLLPLAATAAEVTVRVTGVADAKGKVSVAVCDRERFLKQCAFSGSVPAHAGETVVVVRGVPAGRWAVLAYHDANANGELDRNLLGIPSEDYGFSHAARGKFGPPSFDDAAIDIGEAAVVAVELR